MAVSGSGWLTTTGRIDAYGGIEIPEALMYPIAEHVRSGRLPMTSNHDASKPLDIRFSLVDVRRHLSGELGVYVEFEVEDENFDLSQYTGFSITLVGNPEPPDTSTGMPPIYIYADAGHFDGSTYDNSAVQDLREYFAVGTGRLYQFGAIAPALVIIEFVRGVLQGLPEALLAGGLFEVIKSKFLKQGDNDEDTVFRIKVTGPEVSFTGVVRTKNPVVLKQAFESFQAIALASHEESVQVFDEQSAEWKALDAEGSTEGEH